ncbi:VpaChn25_0724 family phage protein [Aminobacter sp. Piv2-1]|uniref:VpaChn25_0724 family phage protein n=1 Tax=Aminobacter sp. Piv2-1 TaxID=3031122 RepID=UPI00309F9ECC
MLRNSIEPMHAIRRQHQALAILRVLHRDSGQRANDRVLADYLQTIALGGSHEQVRDALQRLAELNLVVVEPVENLVVARLTERGEAVAIGNDSCEGVLRAYPDCPY